MMQCRSPKIISTNAFLGDNTVYQQSPRFVVTRLPIWGPLLAQQRLHSDNVKYFKTELVNCVISASLVTDGSDPEVPQLPVNSALHHHDLVCFINCRADSYQLGVLLVDTVFLLRCVHIEREKPADNYTRRCCSGFLVLPMMRYGSREINPDDGSTLKRQAPASSALLGNTQVIGHLSALLVSVF